MTKLLFALAASLAMTASSADLRGLHEIRACRAEPLARIAVPQPAIAFAGAR
jgi:hypothetical protein